MTSSIERAEAEVQRAIGRATAVSKREGITAGRGGKGAVDSAAFARSRAAHLFLARSAARSRPTTYEHDGARYAVDTTTSRNSEVGTRFGKVAFSRR